ncbi:thioredoxin domain-containing protein [Flavobacteriaceae bacterium TP-CH-4]|uniref:Thioredoxin domain-containing protein n=1 Tax=Pelagihabitans pacificus TaxID=2696054 RepID=A0A967E5Q1_9FLAO|nr:thioredoxin domain-containing protein [Pelagihabitans pacificus]NHF58339.1 thioredoxin domain-containing protein [Pelagihabitans pacificus]
MSKEFTNALIHETSPYLLQHAHNPVNWKAWHPEVLERAKEENKLLLISIGYAACHWCHVMEKECFEDIEVAEVMNAHFVNIKIDREERPDIDHIYMDALQIMTGSGGWPLNIVALPDGRPFWGATYLKKERWIDMLSQLNALYQNQPEKVLKYAQDMAEGIRAINLVENKGSDALFGMKSLKEAVEDWSQYFDTFLGGHKRAPKFMMPVNLNFLLHYSTVVNDTKLRDYVYTTLTRMAWGGIFDHVGGGFSRYSVDTKWHVPHFEKMLYDNGQLVSLYAQAYSESKNVLYKQVVEQTIDFIKTELMGTNHGFYSSLDADSLNEKGQLEEGAYYVWKEKELKDLLGSHYDLFKDYYNINPYGLWERDKYVLIRNADGTDVAQKHKISTNTLERIIQDCLAILRKERDKRNRPRLDDKIIASWNGLMLKGVIDAYRYVEEPEYLELALKNAHFIEKNLAKEDGGLFHGHKNGKSAINGYLEDYATIIDAYIGLYEVSFDEHWLLRAKQYTDYCERNFKDVKSGLFFFTNKQDDFVIRRTLEITDNVVPASNSMMAKNLFKLSRFFPNEGFGDSTVQMLRNVQDNFTKNAQGHANWLQLVLYMNQPFYEVALVGDFYQEKANEIRRNYLPYTLFAGTGSGSELALLKNRQVEGITQFYICQHGSCQLPLTQTDEVLTQLRVQREP